MRVNLLNFGKSIYFFDFVVTTKNLIKIILTIIQKIDFLKKVPKFYICCLSPLKNFEKFLSFRWGLRQRVLR